MMGRPTALIADDEPLLRKSLKRLLTEAWPALEVVAEARNGRSAIEAFEKHRPDVCFLDVHMPGLSGIEAARRIGRRAHLVFVTAFDQYAVEAFTQGAADFLVKPIERARLADTVSRLQERLGAARPALDLDALLDGLTTRLREAASPRHLRWIRVSAGKSVRMVPVDEIDFLRSDEKYTLVAWHDPRGEPGEGLIRTPLKDLLPRLDPLQFAQVHRAVVVNLRGVDRLTRGSNETGELHLKHRDDVLPVSRTFMHHFRDG
jgi:DNA-binding LytR/AlgR family response regulator